MTLMDLALETKDFEWAKQLYNLNDKTLTENKEIKCELAENKNKTKTRKTKNKHVSNINTDALDSVIKELKRSGLYEEYINYVRALDNNTLKNIIRECTPIQNEEDVNSFLVILRELE